MRDIERASFTVIRRINDGETSWSISRDNGPESNLFTYGTAIHLMHLYFTGKLSPDMTPYVKINGVNKP